jgi:pantoate--beta-alanine ligase
MIICKTVSDYTGWRFQQGGRIGVVPTMGYLHEGHLSLVRQIRQACDHVVVTIFVNPTQFNQGEDFERYPRNEDRDCELLEVEGVSAVFIPQVDEVYPEGVASWVTVEGVTESMEGKYRPGHFQGVTTVVTKLFHIIQPQVAIFGEKDFQQLRVIEEMTRSLFFPISILRGRIVREEDGIAMSSRNVRLSSSEREVARAIPRALRVAHAHWLGGESSARVLRAEIRERLREEGIRTEYVSVIDEETLQPVKQVGWGARVCLAAWVGGVRLIDTMRFRQGEEWDGSVSHNRVLL